ncbi:unnamed protein product [Plutella xylostella]|uniref:(diamondback moth) hypothetical protein n=1 Tax=Plutella xylostella TaxID=51655 RepID=A0A8S4FCV8_PLUXY|nr:unnamed protein product [Plutella xylostella]
MNGSKAVICKHCNDNISDGALCSACKNLYHLNTCANITETGWNRLGSRQAGWKCPQCKITKSPSISHSLPTALPSTPTQQVVHEDRASTGEINALASEVRLLTQQITSLKTKLEEATISLSRCNERLEELGGFMVSADQRLKKLESREIQVLELQATVTELKLNLNTQAQNQLKNELELSRIPEHANENLHHVVLVAARKAGVSLADQDIDWISRVGPRRPSATPTASDSDIASRLPRTIVVRMLRRSKRDEFIKAFRTRRSKLTNKDLEVDGPTLKIFCNERLTKENRMLFREARVRSKQHGYAHCWCHHGNIFVRQREGKPSKQIQTRDDLDRLLPCITEPHA